MRILETNMVDGIDVVYNFDTVDEAWKSGRFDWIYEYDRKLWKKIQKCKTVEKLIDKVGYPFDLIDEDDED